MDYTVMCDNCARGVFRRIHIQLTNATNHDLLYFFQNIKSYVNQSLTHELMSRKGIKWYLCINIQYKKQNIEGEYIYSSPYFRSTMQTTVNNHQIDEQIDNAFMKILSSAHEFHREGSSWVFNKIVGFDICIATYNPLKGSSYVELPNALKSKKAIVNVQNSDNKCFLYSVLAGLDERKHLHPNRVTNYLDLVDKVNLDGITFPVPIVQVSKFEKMNNISINVFGYDTEIFPLHITKQRGSAHVNLLLIEKEGIQHYCLIKNMSRLLGDRTRHNGAQWFCNYCLHSYSTKNLLDEHTPLCSVHGVQKTIMPSQNDNLLQFRNFAHSLKVPFIIIADWETLPVPIDTVHPTNNISFTNNTSYHQPASFCYIVVSIDHRYYRKPILYRGTNAVSIFLDYLRKEALWIQGILDKIEPVCITTDDYRKILNQTNCHICGAVLPENEKYLDHCHVTGKVRGYACNVCNLNYKFKNKIPVVFHNLSSFDGHLILNGLTDLKEEIYCVPSNMEHYLSFSIGNLKFIDSYRFLSSSLEKLTANLKEKGLDNFKITQYWTPIDTLDLMTRKQVYPYSYLNNFDKFNEKKLPSKDKFFNELTGQNISDDDYKHAQLVWNTFNMQTLGDYHDMYLTYDVLLLADVMEYFRKLSLNYYKLDPVHYISLPSLSWDACLKFTNVKLELLTDIEMYIFLEAGVRGGIAVVSNRYSMANNVHTVNFDLGKPNKHILAIDANGLYGWSQTRMLPTGNFRWLDQNEIENLQIDEISEDSDIGYILEVDLYYPEYLHNDHSDYPLAPEKIDIDFDMMSPYSQKLTHDLQINKVTVKKLAPNLKNKTRYITHYRNLQLYTSLGMEIIKLHRVLCFSQSCWMRPYIEFNSDKRAESHSTFDQDFFKLMINSNFGKTIESVRKRVNIQLVTCPKKMIRLISKPTFDYFRIFNENLVGIHMRKPSIKLNKPIYLGFSILENSKCLMYNHHYNVMIPNFNELKLLYTDTDSLIYEIVTDDVYEDLRKIAHFFDTSNYPKDHFLYNTNNKKRLGYFKDETGGNPIHSFVGLRSKMYAYYYQDNKHQQTEKKTAKGIPLASIRNKIDFYKYATVLKFPNKIHISSHVIKSTQHKLFTSLQNKTALCPFDDKRFILPNGSDTLAYGHYLIPFLNIILKDVW